MNNGYIIDNETAVIIHISGLYKRSDDWKHFHCDDCGYFTMDADEFDEFMQAMVKVYCQGDDGFEYTEVINNLFGLDMDLIDKVMYMELCDLPTVGENKTFTYKWVDMIPDIEEYVDPNDFPEFL